LLMTRWERIILSGSIRRAKTGGAASGMLENIDEALKEANVCFIFTEWSEIKAVKPETYKQLMKNAFSL